MKHLLMWTMLLVTCSVTGMAPAQTQSGSRQLRLDSDMPQQPSVTPFLQRDLLSYFRRSGFSSATLVDTTLLRNVPTQTGVAAPKYYAWVQVKSGTAVLTQGAVRIAAIEKNQYEVLDFLTAQQIKGNRDAVAKVFPAALMPALLEQASKM